MASIDKEALKKNQFWIGLGVFVAIWLVAIIVVEVSGDTTKKADWEKSKTDIEGAKNAKPKTVEFQKPWNAHANLFRGIKEYVWKNAWDLQKDMYVWPERMAVKPLYPDDEFGSSSEESVNNRSIYRTDLYAPQIDDYRRYVYPVEFDGGFDKVFPKQELDRSRAPTREEIWLTQEDYLVRSEMLEIVHDALVNIAVFRAEPVDPKEKLPEGILGRRVLKNANWQLNLLFVKPERGRGWDISPLSTIKNISVSKKTQPLAVPGSSGGLVFRFLQDGGKFDMSIAGEPLAYGKEMFLKRTFTEPVDLQKPFVVTQVLVWEISPIRRINHLDLAAHSHRTVTTRLKIRDDLKALDPEPTDTSASTAAASTAGGGGGGPAPPGGGPKGMGMGGSGSTTGSAGRQGQDKAADDLTPVNNINRARYLHVTPQCRHLPIAMQVIVDQSHIHDFLAAFGNSRLRIQTTQVLFQLASDVKRYPDDPSAEKSSGTAGGGPAAGGPAGSRPGGPAAGSGAGRPAGGSFSPPGGMRGGGGGGMRGPGGAGLGGSGFGMGGGFTGGGNNRPAGDGGANNAGKAPAFQDNARLVELTVYGIATLYERYPAKDRAKTKTGTTSPAK